jgi:hypothetical protein
MGKIEAGLLWVAFLQHLDHAEALLVVVEPPVTLHQAIQGLLASMTEGGMSKVVSKGDCFGQILVETEGPRDGATDRGDLDRVGQSGTVMVSFAIEENLSLAVESSEGGAVDDPIAVALIAAPEGMFVLRTWPPRAFGGTLRISG